MPLDGLDGGFRRRHQPGLEPRRCRCRPDAGDRRAAGGRAARRAASSASPARSYRLGAPLSPRSVRQCRAAARAGRTTGSCPGRRVGEGQHVPDDAGARDHRRRRLGPRSSRWPVRRRASTLAVPEVQPGDWASRRRRNAGPAPRIPRLAHEIAMPCRPRASTPDHPSAAGGDHDPLARTSMNATRALPSSGFGLALAGVTALVSGISVFVNGRAVRAFDDPVALHDSEERRRGGRSS